MYRYLLSIAGVLGVFTLTEMNQSVARAVARGEDGAFRAAVRFQLYGTWMNALLALAFVGTSAYYAAVGNTMHAASLLVLGLAAWLTSSFNAYLAYLGGKRQFALGNLMSIATTALYAVGMVLAVYLSGDVFWLIFAYAATTVGANIFFYFLTIRMFEPPEGSKGETAETLAYGRRLTYIGLASPAIGQVDSILLTHFWGATALAVYAIALAIPNRGVPFVKSIVSLALPKYAQKTQEELSETFWLRLMQGVTVGLALALAYYIAAPYLFRYLLPQYLEAIPYTRALALLFVFALPNRYLSSLFASQKMPWHLFVSTYIQNVVRFALYVVLGIWGGIWGLVIAQIAYNGFAVVLNVVLWRKRDAVGRAYLLLPEAWRVRVGAA
jgi:O-antigen/teichoic acid export membrane protein